MSQPNMESYAVVARERTKNPTTTLDLPGKAMAMVQELVAAQVSKELLNFRRQTETRLASHERQITRNSETIGKVENKIDTIINDVHGLSTMMQLMMTSQHEMKALLQNSQGKTQSTQDPNDADMENL